MACNIFIIFKMSSPYKHQKNKYQFGKMFYFVKLKGIFKTFCFLLTYRKFLHAIRGSSILDNTESPTLNVE